MQFKIKPCDSSLWTSNCICSTWYLSHMIGQFEITCKKACDWSVGIFDCIFNGCNSKHTWQIRVRYWPWRAGRRRRAGGRWARRGRQPGAESTPMAGTTRRRTPTKVAGNASRDIIQMDARKEPVRLAQPGLQLASTFTRMVDMTVEH